MGSEYDNHEKNGILTYLNSKKPRGNVPCGFFRVIRTFLKPVRNTYTKSKAKDKELLVWRTVFQT